MIKMIVTKAVISKGYDGAAALRYSENTDNQTAFVRFRVGVLVYDKKAEKEHRFVNMNVKAFGYLVDRIKNMKLEAGSYVNIIGRYDEEAWEDKNSKEKKSAPVLIVDEIEYGANGGNGKQNGENGAANGSHASNGNGEHPDNAGSPPSDGFTGYEGFGGNNPYFPGN